MGRPPLDITNQRFGRLVALEYVIGKRWRCRCDCGRIVTIWRNCLRNGQSQSCGCLQRELLSARRRKHGACGSSSKTHTTEYVIWRGIKARCLNPNSPAWKHYGGRGVTMFNRWQHDFAEFLAYVGLRPSKNHSLDRIDNNGNYEPGNVQWIESWKQHGNTRTNRMLTFNGRSQHVSAWARELDVPVYQLNNRLRSGWSTDRTLTEPVHKTHSHRKKGR